MTIGILLLILSYLIGSIPFGLLIGKANGKDLRKSGSGNIGSTNAVRTLGWKLGALSGVCDILKGTIIVILVYILEGTTSWRNPFIVNGDNLYALYGLAAVIGHCFPIYLKFKGGKAVATSFGVLVTVVPWASLVAIIAYVSVLLLTGYVSLSSTVAALLAVITTFIIYGGIYNNFLTSTIILLLALIIFVKHIPNYKRLIAGNENRFNFKKKK